MLLVYVLIHKQEIREGKYSRPMFIGVEENVFFKSWNEAKNLNFNILLRESLSNVFGWGKSLKVNFSVSP